LAAVFLAAGFAAAFLGAAFAAVFGAAFFGAAFAAALGAAFFATTFLAAAFGAALAAAGFFAATGFLAAVAFAVGFAAAFFGAAFFATTFLAAAFGAAFLAAGFFAAVLAPATFAAGILKSSWKLSASFCSFAAKYNAHIAKYSTSLVCIDAMKKCQLFFYFFARRKSTFEEMFYTCISHERYPPHHSKQPVAIHAFASRKNSIAAKISTRRLRDFSHRDHIRLGRNSY
jgi:hypothetical protein